MNSLVKISLILSLAISGTALGEESCGDLPTVPNMPKGKKATMAQMIEAKKSVSNYQMHAKTYRNCLSETVENLAESVEGEATEEAKMQTASLLKDFNKSVEAEEKLAGDFNKSIRDFKKAEAKRKK